MQIFIGGAHNGKRTYVKELLKAQAKSNIPWMEGALPSPSDEPVVIAGLEKWLLNCQLSEEEAIQQVMAALKNREVILILTDIGRGIVPMEAKQRQVRDTCGRLYQRLVEEADEVTHIWYGIPKKVKKRGKLI